MKFVVSKKLNRTSPLFPAITAMLLFFIASLGFNALFVHTKISLVPSQALETIFGNEEAFVEPILFEELAFIVHMEFFFFMLVTLLSFFVHYRLFDKKKSTTKLFLTTFFIQTALLSLLLSPFGGSLFVTLFLLGFYLANCILVYVIVHNLVRIYYG